MKSRFWICVFLALCVGCAVTAILFLKLPPDEVTIGIPGTQLTWSNISTADEEKVLGIKKCIYTACSGFREEEWSDDPGLKRESDGSYSTVITENYRGGTIYLREHLASTDGKSNLTFIPRGSQANVTMSFFDQVQFIIGDGSYDSITCKDLHLIQPGYLELGDAGGKKFSLEKSIRPNTEVEVAVAFAPVPETNLVKFDMVLKKYYSDDNIMVENVVVPSCTIEFQSDPTQIEGRVGVGLLDWQKTGDINTLFKTYFLQRNLP